jgi:hypothetical protein
MPAPTIRRIAATLAAASAAVLATLVPATMASAADHDVQVSLSSLTSSMTAGGRPDNFSIRFENRTDQPIENVRTAIVVDLPGLPADQVHIVRFGVELNRSSNGNGQVTFREAFGQRLEPNRGSSRNYTIQFGAGAPAGRANVTAFALTAAGEQLGAGHDSLTLKSANGPGQPTFTPAPTTPAPTTPAATVPAPVQTGPQVSIAPLAGNGVDIGAGKGGGVPVILYVLGGILVAIGGAILWLLFRRPKDAELATVAYPSGGPAGPYEAGRPRSLGYPNLPPPVSAPTAVLPVVGDQPRAMPPGVDPWAAGNDATRPGPFGPRPS